MPDPGRPLLVVGGGKMGEALLAGWLGRVAAPETVLVVEPALARRELLTDRYGVRAVASPADLPAPVAAGVMLVAVKPQLLEAALPAYATHLAADALVMSIVGGKPIARFEQLLGRELAVVRVMPNTPAAVGRGVSVLCANAGAGVAQRAVAEQLMKAVGEVHWVEDEDLMHAVTAVSGSGPAYVFHLIEALADAGEGAGLPAALASALARATVVGAGELAFRSAEPVGQLRADVTSPGGTTQAALEVLMAPDGLAPLLERAVAAAARRSRELA